MVKFSDSYHGANSDGLASSVLNASTGQFWIWTVVATCAALVCGYGIFYFIRRARIIEDTPTSKIRSAPQGYVEILGHIKYFANESILAPLTQLPCAWYHFKIEKRETVNTGNTSNTRWRTVEEKTSDRVFLCVDETGECVIDPRGAEVYVDNEDTWYGETKWPASPAQTRSWFFTSQNYRYHERRLIESEPLYMLGNFRSVDPNKAHGDVDSEVRAILKVWKQDQQALLDKFDSNDDGQIDLQEWEDVRLAAKQKAYQQRLSRADRPAMNIIGRTNDFRRPFILSVKSPDNMTKGFKLKAFACLVGFVVLAPLSIWLLLVRFSG